MYLYFFATVVFAQHTLLGVGICGHTGAVGEGDQEA